MARRKRNYTVRTGDTAATIAKQLGIDPQTLMRANTGVSNLRAGMVIRQPPTPPAQLPSGGGMYWGKGVYDALQGFGQNVSGYASNAWDQFVNQWQQQPLPTYNVQDIQSQRTWPERIFSPETVAQLAAYQRPAGTPPDPRELFSQYRNSTDLRQQYSQNNLFPATDIRQQYGQGGVWGPNLPSGVKPGLMPAQGTTAVPPGGGVGGDYGFLRDEEGRIIISKEGFDAMHRYGGGAQGLRDLAAIADRSPGGTVRIGGRADEGGFNLKVSKDATGNIRYAPVSGATARSMARTRAAGRGGRGVQRKKSARSWGRKGGGSKKDDSDNKAAVGSAPRYQQGYNFDYDTQGGYMPMVRQKARPGYLGLINWRI